jgi:hypothetical protein
MSEPGIGTREEWLGPSELLAEEKEHTLPIDDDDATQLARRLRIYGDPIGVGVAERLERGVRTRTATIGIGRLEAVVLLNVVERHSTTDLPEVAQSLRQFVETPPETNGEPS